MESKDTDKICINLIHYPIYSLGVGKRIGIWVQGCTHRCKGCIATYTWDFISRNFRSVDEIVTELAGYKNDHPDGITISGGEPFDQPEALGRLLRKMRSAGFNDIMVYSGYVYDVLMTRHAHILNLVDVLIDGQFRLGQDTDYGWKGSENQNMVILSQDKSLRERYGEYANQKTGERKLQIIEKDGKVFIIGIPRQADLEAIKYGIGQDLPNMQDEIQT